MGLGNGPYWGQEFDKECKMTNGIRTRSKVMSKSKRILAIDFATKTGWAYRGEGDEIVSGVWDFSVRADESNGMRLIRFESKLVEMVSIVDVIAFESVSAGVGVKSSFNVVKLQTKMQAIIERMVESREGVECIGYNLQTIKKYALGERKGKRNKEAMMKAAEGMWADQEIIDDNQADALWILDLAWSEINGNSWD